MRSSRRSWTASCTRAVVSNIKGPSWRMREHQALAEAVKQ